MAHWTRPTATEIKMDAEIGSYQGDEDFDSFVATSAAIPGKRGSMALPFRPQGWLLEVPLVMETVAEPAAPERIRS
ncbi:MAG: hypothetical protein GXY23_09975 [Myxococcales bacterium]|mgnify:CR=1 FL=1|nr:hypothetical protein [Myxococcales bacterium]